MTIRIKIDPPFLLPIFSLPSNGNMRSLERVYIFTMIPTARCLAAKPAGFLKRSAGEFSRLSRIGRYGSIGVSGSI
jgi:hypothetical protein